MTDKPSSRMRILDVHEVCPHCDFEKHVELKVERPEEVPAKVDCDCGKTLVLCSICVEVECGDCMDGNRFIRANDLVWREDIHG